MKFNCAAKELCGMQGVPLQEGRHVCMNCMSPMLGGLCGYEFPDGVPDRIDMRLLRANLSAHGQDIAARNSNDSRICFVCRYFWSFLVTFTKMVTRFFRF